MGFLEEVQYERAFTIAFTIKEMVEGLRLQATVQLFIRPLFFLVSNNKMMFRHTFYDVM